VNFSNVGWPAWFHHEARPCYGRRGTHWGSHVADLLRQEGWWVPRVLDNLGICRKFLPAAWLGSFLRRLYQVKFSDMCPFRAIRRDALQRLGMREETYGWNLEMQMRAARAGLRIVEVPVDHRCRAGGRSKVSGPGRGAFVAGARIMTTLLRVALERRSATDGRY